MDIKSCETCSLKVTENCSKCFREYNKVDMWQETPKEVWKSKLFKNAPLMLRHVTDGAFRPYIYINNEELASREYRLPTVEEAPLNVWLCPWDKIPKKLNDFEVILRYKIGITHGYKEYKFSDDSYDDVIAIMILGDLK